MSEAGHHQPMRQPRAVAALAVLLGILLNVAGPASAHLNRDSRAALGNGEIARNAQGLRVAARTGDDGADERLPALLSPQPGIVTDLLSVRPAADPDSATAAPQFSVSSSPYRARAPPAA